VLVQIVVVAHGGLGLLLLQLYFRVSTHFGLIVEFFHLLFILFFLTVELFKFTVEIVELTVEIIEQVLSLILKCILEFLVL